MLCKCNCRHVGALQTAACAYGLSSGADKAPVTNNKMDLAKKINIRTHKKAV